jgi:hypothetical protein
MERTLFSRPLVILFQLRHDLSLGFFHVFSVFAILVPLKELTGSYLAILT